MQAGELIASDVAALTSRVLVNGVQREHESWNVDRSLTGDMPDQIATVNGVAQATGSIAFAGDDVEATARNPWNSSTGWLPRSGDRVQIYAGDGVSEWVQFTGAIDRVSGSVGEGFHATIIDDYDKLSARFSHEPLLRIMPPLTNGDPRRPVGLSSIYFVDAALRRAGFYATPPQEARQILSVPAQTSMWPETGVMTSGVTGGGDGNSWAQRNEGPYGVAISDVINAYSPALSYPLTEMVRYSMTVSPDHNGNTSMKAYYGATDYVELAVAGSRTAIARINGVEVCRLVMGAGIYISLLIKDGAWTLRTETGATSTGTGSLAGSVPLNRITITADAASRVAGFHACHPNTTTQDLYTRHQPTAQYRVGGWALIGLMDASPAIDERPVDDLLAEISRCTLSGMWIDETGAVKWANTLALTSVPTMQNVTTLDDVFSLGWESSLLGVRSRVTVTANMPAVSNSRWRNIELYRGSGASMTSEEVSEEIIEPPSGVDWIMPDETLTILGSGNWGSYNNGTNAVAGVFYSASGDTISDAGLTMTISLERIGVNRYKLKHTAGTYPADVTANLATSPTDAALWPRNRDKGLPFIPGFGKVEWSDTTRSPITAGGAGPELVFDTGYWNSRSDGNTTVIDRIGAHLATQTATPKPVITGLEVTYDPRRQLGDVITIGSPNLLGVYLRVLVVGVSNSAGDSFTQSLTVRVIAVTTTFTTYAEYDKSLGSAALTYAQWQALGPVPQTYKQFNTAS